MSMPVHGCTAKVLNSNKSRIYQLRALSNAASTVVTCHARLGVMEAAQRGRDFGNVWRVITCVWTYAATVDELTRLDLTF